MSVEYIEWEPILQVRPRVPGSGRELMLRLAKLQEGNDISREEAAYDRRLGRYDRLVESLDSAKSQERKDITVANIEKLEAEMGTLQEKIESASSKSGWLSEEMLDALHELMDVVVISSKHPETNEELPRPYGDEISIPTQLSIFAKSMDSFNEIEAKTGPKDKSSTKS